MVLFCVYMIECYNSNIIALFCTLLKEESYKLEVKG